MDSVVADTAIFIPSRPRPSAATAGHALAPGGEPGPVENDDYVSCLVRFASGARGVIEASRVSVAEQNAYGFTIHGTKGMVSWDFRRMGELRVSRGDDYQDQPTSTEQVGPGAGDYAAFQPGAGNSMGYDDLKIIEARDFLAAIATGTPRGATLDDAVRAATVLDAVARSVQSSGWATV
jgi:predicted dehydrogenase